MKVCDRAYVTEDEEEESMSEHSYSPGIFRNTHRHTHILPPAVCVFISRFISTLLKLAVCCSEEIHLPSFKHKALTVHSVAGDSQYPEGAEDRLPPPGSPYYLPDPSQLW